MVIKQRKKKSEKLGKEEFAAFKKWVKAFDTKIDACEHLGLSRPAMDSVLAKGSCHPDTAIKIREALSKEA